MSHNIWLAGFLLATASCRSLALDLTPHVVRQTASNRGLDRAYFLDGEARYGFKLPHDTLISAETGEAHFRYTDLEGAGFVMKCSPQKATVPFSEPERDSYRRIAVRFAPPGSNNVVIKSEKLDPLPINGWTGCMFIVSSSLPGSTIMQEVTFLNILPNEQILLITTAGLREFDRSTARSSEIMNSLRRLGPEEDLSAPVYP